MYPFSDYLNCFIDISDRFQMCEDITIASFNGIDKSCDFIEVAMRMELIVDECGHKTIALIEVFEGAILRMQFFYGDAENGGGFGFVCKGIHFR